MVLMRTKEVIISDPKRQIIAGAVKAVKAIGRAVRSFVGAVEPLDQLLERAEFFRDRVIVCKADDLGDIKLEIITEPEKKLLGSKDIGTVAVSDELEVIRELFQMLECHAHRQDAGTDPAVVRDLIADDGPCSSIDDEPDVASDASDLDVGLIADKDRAFLIGIGIHERFDADSSSLTVVRDHLWRNTDAMDILHCLRGLTQRQAEIDPVGKAQGHDMCIVFAEAQRGGVLRK